MQFHHGNKMRTTSFGTYKTFTLLLYVYIIATAAPLFPHPLNDQLLLTKEKKKRMLNLDG